MEGKYIPEELERSAAKNFKFTVWHRFLTACREYELFTPEDKVGVIISDSRASLLMAVETARHARYSGLGFKTVPIIIGPDTLPVQQAARACGAEPVRLPDGSSLTEAADKAFNEFGCNKAAVCQCFDDMIEELLSGVLYEGRIAALMPKENTGKGCITRPLYMVRRRDIDSWAEQNGLEPDTPPSEKIAAVRDILAKLRSRDPEIDMNLFRSVQNVNLQTLISYVKDGSKVSFLDSFGEGRNVRGTISSPYDT